MRRGQAVTGSSSLVLLLLLQVLHLRYRRHGGQSETPWSVRQRRARGQQQETKGQKAFVDMEKKQILVINQVTKKTSAIISDLTETLKKWKPPSEVL